MLPRLDHLFETGIADSAHVALLDDNFGRLIGWALMFNDYRNKPTAYFYVRARERRRGYATRLVKAISKRFPDTRFLVYGWDTASNSFFAQHTEVLQDYG